MYHEYNWNSATDASVGFDFEGISSVLDKEKNRCILDVGCGKGTIVKMLIGLGYEAYGIDASESGIRIANEGSEETRFFVCNIDDGVLPEELAGKTFDTVISSQVIEHLYSPQNFIRFVGSILAPQGELILTTPYHGYLKNLCISITNGWDRHLSPLWEGGHIKFWSRKTLTELLETNGFEVRKFLGLGRIAFLWKSMMLVGIKKHSIENAGK